MNQCIHDECHFMCRRISLEDFHEVTLTYPPAMHNRTLGISMYISVDEIACLFNFMCKLSIPLMPLEKQYIPPAKKLA